MNVVVGLKLWRPLLVLFAASILTACLHSSNDNNNSPNKALPTYRIMLPELQVPGDIVKTSVAFAVNEREEIIGTFEAGNSRNAYFWDGVQMTNLGGFVPGGADGIAYDLNNQGLVVGSAKVGDQRQAFTWQRGVTTAQPGLDTARPYGDAYGVNESGDVVGSVGRVDQPLAALWHNNLLISLKLLDPATPVSEAYGINQNQTIVGGSGTAKGYAAVMWTDPNTVQALGRLPEAKEEFGLALEISRLNHVTGVTSAKGGRHAFLWKAGQMFDLGDLPGGDDLSIGYGVNDYGHVVGSSQVKPGSGDSQSATQPALLHHAFLWTQESGMVDLNSLIDPFDPLKGKVELLESAVISNSGRIAGRALVDGKIRAYVLIPQEYPVQ